MVTDRLPVVTRLSRRGAAAVTALIAAAGLAAAAAGRPAASAAARPPAVSGTDVSNLTTVTSWPQVQSAGMSFVGIEAVDGATVVNHSYQSQVDGALGQGLFVMPYVVADPLKVADGASQFTDKAWPVIDSVPGAPYAPGGQYLPIALDLESQPLVTPSACYGFSQSAMVTWIRSFITAAAARTGMTPVIYTNPSWWRQCTGDSAAFGADPLWIANYGVSSPQVPPGWADYTFWQRSSSATVAGIQGTGRADLDQMQGAPRVLTAALGAGGSVQLRTLNSLAGQPVSYTSDAALPAGVSLSSAGRLSWTAATPAGSHTVTVTAADSGSPAAAGIVPSPVSLTLRVHGTIALSTRNRSSTAGDRVRLRVPATGQDQRAGFAPSLRAAGLPSGLAMSSAGVITGWLTRPGRYKVTVTAADGLGGTGSASFSWTVRAAGDSGATGQIRQSGGTGKCLNDPGGRTASGTRINLWDCRGKANQKWTAVRDGTLRVRGKCLGTVGNSRSNGAGLQLERCDSGNGAQLWQAASDGQLVNPRSGKCLDVRAARAASGTHPVIEPCANSASRPNEHWLRPPAAITSGLSGRCMQAKGAAVVLASCANVAAQRWQPRPSGTLRRAGKCLRETGTAAGSVLSAGGCSGAAARWKLVGRGPIATEIRSAASGRCVTVPSRGTRLIVASCAASPRGTWHVS